MTLKETKCCDYHEEFLCVVGEWDRMVAHVQVDDWSKGEASDICEDFISCRQWILCLFEYFVELIKIYDKSDGAVCHWDSKTQWCPFVDFNFICCELMEYSNVVLLVYFFSKDLAILEWYWVWLCPNRFYSFHHLDGDWVAFSFTVATEKVLFMCPEYSEQLCLLVVIKISASLYNFIKICLHSWLPATLQ